MNNVYPVTSTRRRKGAARGRESNVLSPYETCTRFFKTVTSKVAILLYVAIFSVLGQAANAQSAACATTVTITAINGNGSCTAAGGTGTVTIRVQTTPTNAIEGANVLIYRNGTLIHTVGAASNTAGTTSVTYVDVAAPAGTYGYDATVNKTGCSDVQTATPATVTVNGTPVAVAGTSSQTICSGQTASFNVTVTGPVAGTLSLTYVNANTGTVTTVSGIPASSTGTTVIPITPNPAPVQTTTYQITAVASSNGCPGQVSGAGTHTVVVNVPPPVGNLGTPQPVCQGGNLVINATPGTVSPTATYQWYKNGVAINNGPTGQGSTVSGANTTQLTISNAQPSDAGQYYFQVCSTDPGYQACSNGCAQTNVVTAVVNPLPTATLAPTSQAGCIGATANYTVTFTGTAPFNYTWQRVYSGGGTTTGTVSSISGNSTTLSFTPTMGGTYTTSIVSVSDVNCVNTVNNTSVSTLTVSNFQAPVSVGGGVQTVCFGAATSRTFTPTGAATTTFTYSLAGPVTRSGTATNTQAFTLSNLTAGNYTLTATDGACTIYTPFTIAQYPQVTISAATTAPIRCFGGSTSVTVTVGGGTTGNLYDITLTGASGFSPASYTGVPAGTYTFTGVTGGSLAAVATNTSTTPTCAVSTPLNVLQPAQIVPNGVPAENAISCYGGTTVLNATATGGNTAGTFTYTLSGGGFVSGSSQTVNNVPAGGTAQFTGLTGGTYTLTVTDANGCVGVQNNINITQATQITGNVTSANAACPGGTGTITVNYTGGGASGNRIFRIQGATTQASPSTASTTYTFNPTPGTYTVTITDSRSCTEVIGVVTINSPAAITATTTVTQPLCAGGTGTLTIGNVQGGTTAGTGIIWTITSATGGVQTSTGNVISPVSAGTYTLSAREGNCPNNFVTTFTVAAPNALTVSFTSTAITCNASTSTVTLTATGGSTNTRTFQLINANTSAVVAQTTNNTGNPGTATFGNIPAGTYYYSVTSGGCTTASDPGTPSTVINIAPYTTPSVSAATVTNVTCFGGSNGQIRVTGTGGTGTRTFAIQGGATSGTTNTTGLFTGLSAGTYTITVSDQTGCAGTATRVTVGGGTASGTGAPNLVLSGSASSNAFAPPVSTVSVEWGVINPSGNSATGVVLRVTKPTPQYTITLASGTTAWTVGVETTEYVEFNYTGTAGGEIVCGTNTPLRVTTIITRTAAATGRGVFPVTGIVRSSVTDSFPADNNIAFNLEAQ